MDDNKIKDVNQKDTRKGIRMDKKLVEYSLVSGGEDEIIDKVNRFIENGWQPLGGVSRDKYHRLSQAMVKYGDEKS